MADTEPKAEAEPETPGLLMMALDEMKRVRSEPRLLVIITHGFIDLMINTLIDVKCKHAKQITNDHRNFTHSMKLLILNELGVLSDHHYRLLTWFNRLRNDFAHQPLFKLTADRLSSFFAKPVHQDITKFDQLCGKVIVDLWMNHMNDIQHVWMPEAVAFIRADTRTEEVPAPKYIIPLKDDPKTIRQVTSRSFSMQIITPPHIQKMADDDEPS